MRKQNGNDKSKTGESRQIKKVLFLFISIIFASLASVTRAAELLVKDDFETGSYSNGWSNIYGLTEITTLNCRPTGGTYSARNNHYPRQIERHMRFHYEIPNYNEIDSLFIRYYLFYEDDPPYQWGSDTNCKFMRLIGPGWGLQTEFEFMSKNRYRVCSYGASGTQGTTYVDRDYINGEWVKVEILLIYDNLGQSDGTLKIWFNDQLSLIREGNYAWRGLSSQKYEAIRIPCIRGVGTSMDHDNFWQIDDIEIWNGMPNPQPPEPLDDPTPPSPSEPSDGFLISNLFPSNFGIGSVHVGETVYIDRTYALLTGYSSEYEGSNIIKTACDDKYNSSDSYLSFDVKRDSTVFVCFEQTTSPNWLSSGFVKTNDTISRTGRTYDIWSTNFPAGSITLGGSSAEGADEIHATYFVLVKESSENDTRPTAPAGHRILTLGID